LQQQQEITDAEVETNNSHPKKNFLVDAAPTSLCSNTTAMPMDIPPVEPMSPGDLVDRFEMPRMDLRKSSAFVAIQFFDESWNHLFDMPVNYEIRADYLAHRMVCRPPPPPPQCLFRSAVGWDYPMLVCEKNDPFSTIILIHIH
jgi:hypothetical protein